MKVLFLDNDGVICLQNNWGSRFKKWEDWGGGKLSMPMREIPIEYRFDDFDPKSVEVLNEILQESGAEIVVSSDWKKHATCSELGDYYEMQGIIKRPIDMTELILHKKWIDDGFISAKFPWNINESLEQERHFEIKRWLMDHPEVTQWVAVDDLHMGIHIENSWMGPHDRDWGLEHFVWTPHNDEGIKQTGIKEDILKHLTD